MQAVIFPFSEAGQLYSMSSPTEHTAAKQYSLVQLLGLQSIFQFVKEYFYPLVPSLPTTCRYVGNFCH